MRAEIFSTDDIESHRICVVYQRRSGRIVHVHEVVTLRGGHTPAERDVEAQAVELAEARLKKGSALSVLQVDPATVRREATYKVNVKNRRLVELKAKRRR